ncbi:MAG: hypothetical protein BM557_02470 [Flavobacterium sp. MedPE-SWcel]|uniref:hypothetical protein n=1 Tax=uncultured Flavobacterium sp. TaxID=165435 RepID=UPI0009163636|nr:hypothetical protein [uncultured Flavobacterium sp.]OIQ21682.1 MAG: hypothetical protein BM557_02470 [Flavobacterium sp. MedPE-SWcel]
MKKIILAAICLLGAKSVVMAQETTMTTTKTTTATGTSTTTIYQTKDEVKHGWYLGLGVVAPGDYKINDKLKAAGMPELPSEMFELSIGYNLTYKRFSLDGEFGTGYMDKKTASDRVTGLMLNMKLRGHYMFLNKGNYSLSAGVDLTYANNTFDLYSRGNVIDLDDLNPATHSGHISLYNNQFLAGPSLAFGAFQKSNTPVRLNVGYDISLISGKWKSEVANVSNSLKESDLGVFYAKVVFML